MRACLFFLIAFVIALPINADGLLPSNPPAPWKALDASDLASQNQVTDREVWMNGETGDVLIAFRLPDDRDGSSDSLTSTVEAARSSLRSWFATKDDRGIETLSLRNTDLFSISSTHSRKGVERGDTTKRPVALVTLVLEADSGNAMANSLSYTKDGHKYMIQHVSTRPISNSLTIRMGSWAMRYAKLDSNKQPIEP